MHVVRRELHKLQEIRFVLLADLSVRLRARAKPSYLARHRNGEYVRVISSYEQINTGNTEMRLTIELVCTDRKTLQAKFRDFGADYRVLALRKLCEYLRNNSHHKGFRRP